MTGFELKSSGFGSNSSTNYATQQPQLSNFMCIPLFKKDQPRPLFVLLESIFLNNYRIIGVEGEHADHLTTTVYYTLRLISNSDPWLIVRTDCTTAS